VAGEQDLFTSLNPYGGLQFLAGATPEQLQKQLESIKSPLKLVNLYHDGKNHIAWFLCDVKIKKINKGK